MYVCTIYLYPVSFETVQSHCYSQNFYLKSFDKYKQIMYYSN